jgi:hypothetical protein
LQKETIEMSTSSNPETCGPRVRQRQKPAAADVIFGKAIAQLALQIVEFQLSELKPSDHNARIHTRKQIHLVAESIKGFGFVAPILVNGTGEIIAGHGRYEAAKLRHARARGPDHLRGLRAQRHGQGDRV